jgi:hypothetical protein
MTQKKLMIRLVYSESVIIQKGFLNVLCICAIVMVWKIL